jgi:hypothetical protein
MNEKTMKMAAPLAQMPLPWQLRSCHHHVQYVPPERSPEIARTCDSSWLVSVQKDWRISDCKILICFVYQRPSLPWWVVKRKIGSRRSSSGSENVPRGNLSESTVVVVVLLLQYEASKYPLSLINHYFTNGSSVRESNRAAFVDRTKILARQNHGQQTRHRWNQYYEWQRQNTQLT